MKVIGITGGVGAGKSRILEYISSNYNCDIIMADKAAHMLEEPGRKCYDELTALLGDGILNDDRSINKAKMAEKIFTDKNLLEKVNDIVHPAVKEYVLEYIHERKKENKLDFLFIEAALLIEAGYTGIVDELWYIHTDIGIRRQRLKSSRAYTDEKIDSIIQKQLSEEEFRKHCSVIIDNSGDFESACKQIDRKLEEYLWQKQ
ncbi:MAG: dephospho-CoA kinase [Lachnospiraceae bacterium]|nr:dephospho-CoA kinase [Lachnospiraceae bacterium]